MGNLFLIIIFFMGFKIFAFWFVTKLKDSKRKPVSAEDIIRCKGMHPDVYEAQMRQVIVDYSRDSELEEEYDSFIEDFKIKMRAGKISRGKILGIKEYLENNVNGYDDKKNFKNDAHAIYTMLKATDLQIKHIKTIEWFINS